MNSTRCKLPSLSSSWNDFPFSDSSDSEECNDIGVRWNIPWRVSCYKWVKSFCVDSLFARLVNFGFGIQHKVWATVSLRQDGLKYSWLRVVECISGWLKKVVSFSGGNIGRGWIRLLRLVTFVMVALHKTELWRKGPINQFRDRLTFSFIMHSAE